MVENRRYRNIMAYLVLGIGVVIVMDQVPKLLCIHFHKGPFVHNVLSIAQGIPDASLATS